MACSARERLRTPLCAVSGGFWPNLSRWPPLPAAAFLPCSAAGAAAQAEPTVEGTARLGERTKHLVKRLRPGEVAVIDHVDVDRIAAEELIEAGVVAVLNAAPSSSGRYPNAGPLMLARAGIALVDAPDAELFERLKEGDRVRLLAG